MVLFICILSASSVLAESSYAPAEAKVDILGSGTYTMTNVDDDSQNQTISCDGRGTFAWEIEEPGEYVYRVTSDQAGEQAEFQVTFSAYVESGELSVATVIKCLNNDMKMDVVDYVGCWSDPPVEKIIVGNPTEKEVFHFRLEAQELDSPMPEGSNGNIKEGQVTGAGLVEFGSIHFLYPGVYNYTVHELQGTNPNCNYDMNVYTIRMTVTRESDRMKCVNSFFKNGMPLVGEDHVKVTNTYVGTDGGQPGGNPDSPGISHGKTGDSHALYGYTAALTISVLFCAFVLTKKSRERDSEDA